MALVVSDYRDIALACRMIVGTFTASEYATGGIVVDFDVTDGFETKVFGGYAIPDNAATRAYVSSLIEWPSTSVSTAIKLFVCQPQVTIYDNDDAASHGVAMYCDEDQASGQLVQFVAPSDADVTQAETMAEMADETDTSSMQWQIIAWGY